MASDAPDWIEAMAMSSSPTGKSAEPRLRDEVVIGGVCPGHIKAEATMMINWFGMGNILLKFVRAICKAKGFEYFDRKTKLTVDGELYLSIIRPTSGAVETENSLVNNELCEIRQQVASVYR
ncbi:hypothetical protein, partial [Pseudomonas proteolytica]|uniref:hypothetical protein n=1 Tax=Pseudomonas proteolytica TaxID=219574 RepID=UPI001CA3C1BB